MKLPCEIIKDLLPLYCDEVCSNETKNIVEEHIKECENCKKEAEKMSCSFGKAEKLNENDEKIAIAAKKSWRKKGLKGVLIGAVVMMSIVLIGFGINAIYHYHTSAKQNDLDGLKNLAITSAKNYPSILSKRENIEASEIIKTKRDGDWLAVLFENEEGIYLYAYQRDEIFKDRWHLGFSTSANKGEMCSLDFGYCGDNLNVFGAVDLDGAKEYHFTLDGIKYICPIEDGVVLDVFLMNKGYYTHPYSQEENDEVIVYEDGSTKSIWS